MIGDTFVSYRGFRWFWFNIVVLLIAIGFYCSDIPLGGHRGSTLYGYALGILSFLLILVLMWYGMRKRTFHAKYTTLQGCLSFHIWTGLALLLLVPLHCGFQFHLNIHTLAYVLMVFTILSGSVGAYVYRVLAAQIPSHRGEGSLARQLSRVEDLSKEIEGICRKRTDQFLRVMSELDIRSRPSYWWLVLRTRNLNMKPDRVLRLIDKIPEYEREEARRAVSLIDQKIDICRSVGNELRTLFFMRTWLFVHVPLSFGVVVAVLVHIFVVMYMP